jgi:hypothetical protein
MLHVPPIPSCLEFILLIMLGGVLIAKSSQDNFLQPLVTSSLLCSNVLRRYKLFITTACLSRHWEQKLLACLVAISFKSASVIIRHVSSHYQFYPRGSKRGKLSQLTNVCFANSSCAYNTTLYLEHSRQWSSNFCPNKICIYIILHTNV